MSKHYDVTLVEVKEAWKSVRKAGGASGVDGKTIRDIEEELDNQLYKVSNRMSSGSYIAQPVLLVNIPKVKGGFRKLGIPTVTDRIAQMVVKNRIESKIDKLFYESSYAYRPKKSAIDAVGMCRDRCLEYKWVVEIDIKGFFDNLDHVIMMNILGSYIDDKMVLLYSERFLKAKGMKASSKEEVSREVGTPQGGVISPVLANLYLHEAFDKWMEKQHRNIKYERYADDIIIHCISESQAKFIKDAIRGRLKKYKLELNEEKSKMVYVGRSNQYNDYDYRKHELHRKFIFLGYDFKPRISKIGLTYSPAISSGALKKIRDKIRQKWQITSRIGETVEDIAKSINPEIRGWINYYGHYRRSELYRMSYMINNYIAKFIKKKYSCNSWAIAWNKLFEMKRQNRDLFAHWNMIGSQERRAV